MINFEINKWRGRFFRYAPLILWIGVIFAASSKMGAMSNTSLLIRPFLMWLFPNASEDTITHYHLYIRKLAHFTEYGILAFWTLRAFSGSANHFIKRFRYIIAFFLILLIASLDEYNQSFNPLRTSSIYDVLLDCAGGLTVITLFLLYGTYEQNA